MADYVSLILYCAIMFQDDKFSHFTLEKCSNPQCNVSPVNYLAGIQNSLTLVTRKFIHQYYEVSRDLF
jgi:hypothetical protein